MFQSLSAVAVARSVRGIRTPLAALALASWFCSTGYALEIVSVEEHWELSIGEPDVASSSPQVSMVMAPDGDLYDEYFVFTLNHRSEPQWAAGGMQVQLWDAEDLLESQSAPQLIPLGQTDETVSWVQRTKLEDGHLVFEVVAGDSSSWGAFGDDGSLSLSVPTSLTNLINYRPAISLEESGTSFAGNRVRSLTLTKLRWVDATGEVYELNAPIDVDSDLDP